MTDAVRCESCTMTVESGPYCHHCAPTGELIPFDEAFARMTQWARRQDGLEQAEAEERTLAFMAERPAWKDHPRVRAARKGR